MTKLQDPNKIARLRADGLMCFHVYADLVMLSKSNDLGKSVIDMNRHYLLLQLKKLNATLKLYWINITMCSGLRGSCMEIVNHCCQPHSQAVYNKLFKSNEDDCITL